MTPDRGRLGPEDGERARAPCGKQAVRARVSGSCHWACFWARSVVRGGQAGSTALLCPGLSGSVGRMAVWSTFACERVSERSCSRVCPGQCEAVHGALRAGEAP